MTDYEDRQNRGLKAGSVIAFILVAIAVSGGIIAVFFLFIDDTPETFDDPDKILGDDALKDNTLTIADTDVIQERLDFHFNYANEQWNCILFSPTIDIEYQCRGFNIDDHPPEVRENWVPYEKGATIDYTFNLDFTNGVKFTPAFEDKIVEMFQDKIIQTNSEFLMTDTEILNYKVDIDENTDPEIVFRWTYE